MESHIQESPWESSFRPYKYKLFARFHFILLLLLFSAFQFSLCLQYILLTSIVLLDFLIGLKSSFPVKRVWPDFHISRLNVILFDVFSCFTLNLLVHFWMQFWIHHNGIQRSKRKNCKSPDKNRRLHFVGHYVSVIKRDFVLEKNSFWLYTD